MVALVVEQVDKLASEGRCVSVSPEEADRLFEEAWQTGLFDGFVFQLGVACGSHMMESEAHSCCLIEVAGGIHDIRKRRGEPTNPLGLIRMIRDQAECGCDCCKELGAVCCAVLAERERRISLQMVGEDA